MWLLYSLANLLVLSIWQKKVWWMNRFSQKVIIVCRNLDGFSLVNQGWFTKLSPCQTFPLYGIYQVCNGNNNNHKEYHSSGYITTAYYYVLFLLYRNKYFSLITLWTTTVTYSLGHGNNTSQKELHICKFLPWHI